MKLSDFDYELPKELIAQEALQNRSQARMMVLEQDGQWRHSQVTQLPDYFAPGDLIVFNNTRVLPAKLLGHKETGGKVDALVLNETPEPKNPLVKKALLRASNIVTGNILTFEKDGKTARAKVLGRIDGGHYFLEFEDEDVLHKIGAMPLPPYIKKTLEDPERYQTIYSKEEGSLAAPTAGLHFTPELFDALRARGVDWTFVTLHVGLGTFETIRTENVEDWTMHSELCSISQESADKINSALESGRRLVPVGTTTVRTLESMTENARIVSGEKWTNIFIYPGYQFKCAYSALVTNFHLPESSLLLLISAWTGREPLLKAYREAILQRYRFYSLGDAMLINYEPKNSR